MSVTIKVKKSHRLRSRKDLGHNPSGHGKGRWHSRTCLWRWKMKARRKRQVSNLSRRQNR